METLIFFTDENIHGTVIRQLRSKGITVVTCAEAEMLTADDEDILRYAAENGYIIVTCDDDFLRLDTLWQENHLEHGGIIYFRMRDQCKKIGVVVKEILQIHALIAEEAGTIANDLYNKVWRVKS